MSSVGLSGISGISDNTLQNRYEKALKQINKLIEMNRQLKDALTEQEDQVIQLQTQIENLKKENQNLDEEMNKMDAEYMDLEKHCRQLQQYVSELQAKFDENQVHNQHYQTTMRKTEEKFNEELENQMMKNNELSREAQMLNQMYQQSLASIQQESQKAKELQQQNEDLRARNIKLSRQLDNQKQQLSMYAKDRNINELERKLDKANETIDRLVKQCNELRNKQIDIEVMDERKKVEKYIGFNTINDGRQSDAIKTLVAEYRRKYKTLEHEKKQIERKYKHHKIQSEKHVPEAYIRKIQSLERLTEKQQAQIATLIQTYDFKLNNMAAHNQKLKESCKSLQNQLVKKSTDLTDKEKQILNLKYNTDKIAFENESLKRVNDQLSANNSSRLKQLSGFQRNMSQADSYTMMDKNNSDQYRMSFDTSFKKREGGSSLITPNSPLYHAEPKERASFQPNDSKRIPFFSSASTDPNDFKFIQSVNIINGYNVNLGENSPQPAKL